MMPARCTRPPFRADHVGSLLRPQRTQGRVSRLPQRQHRPKRRFATIQDRCIREAVEHAGGGRPAVDHRWRVPPRLLVSRLCRGGRGADHQGRAVRFPRRRRRQRHVPDRLCRGQAAARARDHDRRIRLRARAHRARTPKVTHADAEPGALSSRRPDRQPRGLSRSRRVLGGPDRDLPGGAARARPRSAAATCSSTKCRARCCAIPTIRAHRSRPTGIDPAPCSTKYIWAVEPGRGAATAGHDDRACICAGATTRAAGWPRAATSRSPKSCSTRSRSTRSFSNTTPSAPADSSRCGSMPEGKTVVLGLVSSKTPSWSRSTACGAASTRPAATSRSTGCASARNADLPAASAAIR